MLARGENSAAAFWWRPMFTDSPWSPSPGSLLGSAGCVRAVAIHELVPQVEEGVLPRALGENVEPF